MRSPCSRAGSTPVSQSVDFPSGLALQNESGRAGRSLPAEEAVERPQLRVRPTISRSISCPSS